MDAYSASMSVFNKSMRFYIKSKPYCRHAIPIYIQLMGFYSETMSIYTASMSVYSRSMRFYIESMPFYNESESSYSRSNASCNSLKLFCTPSTTNNISSSFVFNCSKSTFSFAFSFLLSPPTSSGEPFPSPPFWRGRGRLLTGKSIGLHEKATSKSNSRLWKFIN